MSEKIIIRKGEEKDIDFIIETIIEAEKSFTDKISYENIFSLSHEELVSIFRKVLKEDITGQELCYSDYLVAEVEDEYAGACCAWVEGANGFSSAVVKADVLFEFIPHEKINLAQKYFHTLQQLNIEREKQTLQIVNAYIKAQFRGKGLVGILINEHILLFKEKFPQLKKVQLRPTITNSAAIRAYNKLGFELILEQSTQDEAILDMLPAKGKYLMEKMLE